MALSNYATISLSVLTSVRFQSSFGPSSVRRDRRDETAYLEVLLKPTGNSSEDSALSCILRDTIIIHRGGCLFQIQQ